MRQIRERRKQDEDPFCRIRSGLQSHEPLSEPHLVLRELVPSILLAYPVLNR
jgi:hypothetical protein